LGNNKNDPMLIGSNGGVTIVDTNISSGETGYGSAVVLKGGGIGMHGSTINLTTANEVNTNVVSLSSTGIVLASTAGISLASGNISLTGGNISLTGGQISLASSGANLNMTTSQFQLDITDVVWDQATFTKEGTWEGNQFKLTNGTYYTGYLYNGGYWYFLNSEGKVRNSTIHHNGDPEYYFYFDNEGHYVAPRIHLNRNGIDLAGPRLRMNG
jgi:hypothetical protein